MPRGRFLFCANGSHCRFIDDHDTYFRGLIAFLRDVDTAHAGKVKPPSQDSQGTLDAVSNKKIKSQ